jgi:exodeoxyribonuclease VIII
VHVSRSVLVDLLRSPAHCYALHYDPARPPRPAPTPAMILGTLTHTAVLEPEHFATRHPIAPKCDRRTNAGKADWAAFCASLEPGQEPADAEQVETAQAMAKSLRSVTAVANLLSSGEAEVSAYSVIDGVPCRVRPDWVKSVEAGVILFDAKSTIANGFADASPRGFANAVVKHNYDFQTFGRPPAGARCWASCSARSKRPGRLPPHRTCSARKIWTGRGASTSARWPPWPNAAPPACGRVTSPPAIP